MPPSSPAKIARRACNFPSYLSASESRGSTRIYNKFVNEKFARCEGLHYKNLQGHFGCVNAIEFSSRGGEFIVSGGDDRRVLLWNVEASVYGSTKPTCMKGQHRSNIFCTLFDSDNSHIYSAGNDDQVLRHDLKTGEVVGTYFHDDPIYGLSVHPDDDSIFLSACDDGRVLLTDIRVRPSSGAHSCIARSNAAFHAAVFNPVDCQLVATANSKHGIQIWDTRKPMRYLHHYDRRNDLCAMCVKWSQCGNYLTALRRRLPPALYKIDRHAPLIEFEHPGYSNVCTMKSNCFAGDKDQYIVSGSDDFNVYVWKIPDVDANDPSVTTVGRAAMVLSSHRSIVNQVRFNPYTHMLCSAGVEKVVKVWSPFPLPGGEGTTVVRETGPTRRDLYSHNDYVELVLGSGRPLSHEYDECSVEEDPRMLAFFDSLIQRELSGWHSDSTATLSPDEFYLNFVHPDSSGSSDEEAVGISIRNLREIFSRHRNQAFEQAGSEDHNVASGNIRRTRTLNRRRMLRELLRTISSTSSSSETSSDSGEESHAPLILPSPPRSDSDGTVNEVVSFRRSRTARQRQYRRRTLGRRSCHENDSSDGVGDEDNGSDDGNEASELTSAAASLNHFSQITKMAAPQNSTQGIETSETEEKLVSDQSEATETTVTRCPMNGELYAESLDKKQSIDSLGESCNQSTELSITAILNSETAGTNDSVVTDTLCNPETAGTNDSVVTDTLCNPETAGTNDSVVTDTLCNPETAGTNDSVVTDTLCNPETAGTNDSVVTDTLCNPETAGTNDSVVTDTLCNPETAGTNDSVVTDTLCNPETAGTNDSVVTDTLCNPENDVDKRKDCPTLSSEIEACRGCQEGHQLETEEVSEQTCRTSQVDACCSHWSLPNGSAITKDVANGKLGTAGNDDTGYSQIL